MLLRSYRWSRLQGRKQAMDWKPSRHPLSWFRRLSKSRFAWQKFLFGMSNRVREKEMEREERTFLWDGRRERMCCATTPCLVLLSDKIRADVSYLHFSRRKGFQGMVSEISDDILSKPSETTMMMIPCFLYFVQNNLLLLAVANLDPPVYYVVSQVTTVDSGSIDVRNVLARRLKATFVPQSNPK